MSPSTSKGHGRGHPRVLILGAAPAFACVSSSTSGQLGGQRTPRYPAGLLKLSFIHMGCGGWVFPPPQSSLPLPRWGEDVFLGPLLSLFHVPSLSSRSGCPPRALLSPKPFSASCSAPLELSSSPSPGRASALCHSQAASANSPGSPLSLGPDSWNSSECRPACPPAPSSLGTGGPRFLPAPLAPLVPRSADELALFLFFVLQVVPAHGDVHHPPRHRRRAQLRCVPDPPPARGQIPLGFWESCCGFLPLVSSSISGSSSGFSPRLSLPGSPRAALPAAPMLPGV